MLGADCVITSEALSVYSDFSSYSNYRLKGTNTGVAIKFLLNRSDLSNGVKYKEKKFD
ncbi:MAG: hypothetical protein LBT18_01045 [Endomicrobium sp.]|nr:hypothetical protein [Endomicrobium sp.]